MYNDYIMLLAESIKAWCQNLREKVVISHLRLILSRNRNAFDRSKSYKSGHHDIMDFKMKHHRTLKVSSFNAINCKPSHHMCYQHEKTTISLTSSVMHK